VFHNKNAGRNTIAEAARTAALDLEVEEHTPAPTFTFAQDAAGDVAALLAFKA